MDVGSGVLQTSFERWPKLICALIGLGFHHTHTHTHTHATHTHTHTQHTHAHTHTHTHTHIDTQLVRFSHRHKQLRRWYTAHQS